MIYIASDHGGFNLKTEVIKHLHSKQIEVTDLGPYELNMEDDYPDYTYPLAQRVSVDTIENKGILICRNGVGVSMLANKVKGVRATLSWSPEHAASSRSDDNTNVLALPADYISYEKAVDIIEKWLSTPFSNENRHKRRIEKVSNIEKHL